MGLRKTVLAVAGVGVLAMSCKGFNASNLVDGSKLLGRAGLATERAEKVCRKLEVEPTVQEEYAIGSAMAINWVQRGGGLMQGTDADAMHRYVNVVGKNLAAQSLRPTLEWTFGVLDDAKSFNAVSAPGGYVFVTRKLLAGLENEGQLAGVLAHEIAHIVLKHSIEKYNQAKVGMCKSAIISDALVPGSGQLIDAGEKGTGNLDLDKDPALLGGVTEKAIDLFDDGNGEDQEFAADAMAARLMLSAGYDPDDYRRLIAKTSEDTTFVNHPKKADRVKKLVAFIATLKPKDGEFAELSTEGLHSPPLKPALTAALRTGGTTGVAKDTK